MRRSSHAARIAIALAVGTGLLLAPASFAATPRPACDLVSDPSGDVMPSPPGVDSGDYDVRSADIATDAKRLTAVIRLTSLAPEDPASAVARDYEFDFVANGHGFGLLANLVTGGASFNAVVFDRTTPGGRTGTDLGQVTGVIDTARHEIRMTAPLRLFAPYASFKQTYVDQLEVTSARAAGHGGTSVADKVFVGSQSVAYVVDDASSNARYSPGGRSCVRVGK
jgi:hypothetical protein